MNEVLISEINKF